MRLGKPLGVAVLATLLVASASTLPGTASAGMASFDEPVSWIRGARAWAQGLAERCAGVPEGCARPAPPVETAERLRETLASGGGPGGRFKSAHLEETARGASGIEAAPAPVEVTSMNARHYEEHAKWQVSHPTSIVAPPRESRTSKVTILPAPLARAESGAARSLDALREEAQTVHPVPAERGEDPRRDGALGLPGEGVQVASRARLDPTPAGSRAYAVAGFASLAALALGLALGLPLFSRIKGSRALDHPSRARIHERLAREPGRTPQELARALGMNLDTLRYHLRQLEKTGHVVSRRVGRRARYFIPGQAVNLLAAEVTATEVARRLAEAVRAAPGSPLVELSRRTGTAPPLCHYHLQRLAGAGIVVAEGEGRARVYRPA